MDASGFLIPTFITKIFIHLCCSNWKKMKCYKLFFGKYLSMRSSIVTFVNNLLLLLNKTTKYTMSESDSQVNAHVREIDQKLSLMERELAVKQQIIVLSFLNVTPWWNPGIKLHGIIFWELEELDSEVCSWELDNGSLISCVIFLVAVMSKF
jgi:hypothetical protein